MHLRVENELESECCGKDREDHLNLLSGYRLEPADARCTVKRILIQYMRNVKHRENGGRVTSVIRHIRYSLC